MSEREQDSTILHQVARGASEVLERSLGDLLEEMRGLNAGTMQMVVQDGRERPLGGVILLRESEPEANQAVIDAINRVTEDEDDWIPVTERLPAYHEDVLVFGGLGASDDDPQTELGYLVPDGTWWLTGTDHLQLVGVTDWQPLPGRPKRHESEHAG